VAFKSRNVNDVSKGALNAHIQKTNFGILILNTNQQYGAPIDRLTSANMRHL